MGKQRFPKSKNAILLSANAFACKELSRQGLSQKAIQEKLGVSRHFVMNHLKSRGRPIPRQGNFGGNGAMMNQNQKRQALRHLTGCGSVKKKWMSNFLAFKVKFRNRWHRKKSRRIGGFKKSWKLIWSCEVCNRHRLGWDFMQINSIVDIHNRHNVFAPFNLRTHEIIMS